MGMNYATTQKVIDGTGRILDTTVGSPDSGSYITEAQLLQWVQQNTVLFGYLYNGVFYTDAGHTSPVSGSLTTIYVDITGPNEAIHRYNGVSYVALTEEAQVQAVITALQNGTLVPLKAKQDQNGNVIDTTYETKADAAVVKARVGNLQFEETESNDQVVFEGDPAETWAHMERHIPTEPNDGEFLCSDDSAPSDSSAAGLKGQFFADENYFYICIADNTWRRVALSTF